MKYEKPINYMIILQVRLAEKYSLWEKGNQVVGIHDDDDDIVSIFDLEKQEYIYLDEKTKKGIKIIDGIGE